MKLILKSFTVIIWLCLTGFQSEPLSPLFAKSEPYKAKDSNQIIKRHLYVLSNNAKTKFPDWVAYRIDHSYESGPQRGRNWKKDPDLDASVTLEPGGPDDYKDAYALEQYDRGHMAPLASFDGSEYWAEVNYLSNITPQKENLNRGPWEKLEEAERDLINKCNLVYVYCGTLYESPMPKLPNADEEHSVPSSFWKVVVCTQNTDTLVASFIFPQTATRSSGYLDYSSTLKEVERRSGYDLFRGINNKWEQSFSGFVNDEWMLKLTR